MDLSEISAESSLIDVVKAMMDARMPVADIMIEQHTKPPFPLTIALGERGTLFEVRKIKR